jgi:3-oxoacyl-[acyl-carrier-protein] synthase II
VLRIQWILKYDHTREDFQRRRNVDAKRRVVVTGLGLITPCGTGLEKSWSNLVEGRSGIGPITLFDAGALPVRIAGEVRDFRAEDFLERRELRRMDRFQHLAVAAAEMALADAGVRAPLPDAERVATIVGSGIGGIASLEATHRKALEKGADRISPFFILQMVSSLAPGYLSIRFGFKGPSYATSSACSTSAHAVGEAMRAIQRGDVDAALAGGSEAPITMLAVGGFCAMRALSQRNHEPEKASRPFDRSRDGFVVGEGAGLLFLEERERALRRGARIHAELTGYGASSDAHHETTPAPRHEGGARAMRLALREAGLPPEKIGYLNAHATSTEVGDVLEAQGIEDVFGAHATRLPVSASKSMLGHLNGAAGAVEAVISVLALERGVLPPTINVDELDPEIRLDVIPNRARRAKVEAVMSNSFGFGGTNVSLVFANP